MGDGSRSGGGADGEGRSVEGSGGGHGGGGGDAARGTGRLPGHHTIVAAPAAAAATYTSWGHQHLPDFTVELFTFISF